MKMHAVVTGGNKGIGFEICKQLASNGVFVILTARNEKLGNEAVHKLTEMGLSDVVFHRLDLTDSDGAVSLAEFINANFGKLDILVNNAAAPGLTIRTEILKDLQLTLGQLPEVPHLLFSQSYEEAQECINVNYYGTKAVSETLLPLLQTSPSPKIVNVTSVYGQLNYIPSKKIREELNNVDGLKKERIDELVKQFLEDFREGKLEINGWPEDISAYKVSKAAVNAYTRVLAKELSGFLVNCVHPGLVRTDLNPICGNINAEEGARGPVMLALLHEGGPSGLYFDQMEVSSF